MFILFFLQFLFTLFFSSSPNSFRYEHEPGDEILDNIYIKNKDSAQFLKNNVCVQRYERMNRIQNSKCSIFIRKSPKCQNGWYRCPVKVKWFLFFICSNIILIFFPYLNVYVRCSCSMFSVQILFFFLSLLRFFSFSLSDSFSLQQYSVANCYRLSCTVVPMYGICAYFPYFCL